MPASIPSHPHAGRSVYSLLFILRPGWWAQQAGRLGFKRLASLSGSGRLAAGRDWLAPRLPYWTGVAVLALLAGQSLLQFKMLSGHDVLVYPPRDVEFYRALQAGELLPRWAPDLGAGYGEPFFIFNPPVIYYLGGLFQFLGAGLVASTNLAALALLFIAGFGMYFLASEFFGPRGGLASAAAYLFAPYLLVNLYVRHSFTDFAAFAFMPYAVLGLYRFARLGEARFLVCGSVGLALLMLSSNPVALMFAPVLGILLAGLYWKERDTDMLVRGAWCIVLGLGLSAYFWLPAFVERELAHYERMLTAGFEYYLHFLSPIQLIASSWGYGYSQAGLQDGMSFSLSAVQLIVITAALWSVPRLLRSPGYGAWAVLIALLVLAYALFMTTDLARFIWDRVTLLHTLQFPWRFLSIAAFAAAWLVGFPFLLWPAAAGRRGNILLVGLILALLILELPHARPQEFLSINEADYTPESIALNGLYATSGREEEPIFVEQRPPTAAQTGLEFLSGAGQVISGTRSPHNQQYTVEVLQGSQLQANTFFFPGWILLVDGLQQPVSIHPIYGTMQFSLPPGVHQVELRFTDTPIRKRAGLLSLLALIALAVTPLMRPIYRPHNRPAPAAETRPGIGSKAGAALLKHFQPTTQKLFEQIDRYKTELGLYLLLFAVYLPTTIGHFWNNQQLAVYLTTQSLVEKGSLAIQPFFEAVQGPSGEYYSVWGLGQALLSIPLYLLGRQVERIGSPVLQQYFSGPALGEWGGTIPIFFVNLLNVFVSPLICLVFYRFELRLGFSRRAALFTSLLLGFSTQIWLGAHDYFQHPLETLLLLVSIYIIFTQGERLTPRFALAAGAVLALGVLTRLNLLLAAPLVAAYLIANILAGQPAAAASSTPRRGLLSVQQALRCLLAFAAPVILIFLVILWLNNLRYGDPLVFNPPAQAQGFALSVLLDGVYGYLFSPGRSVWLFSLPVLLGLWFYPRFFQQQRREALLFLALTVTYLLFYSSFVDWMGGWSYGPRYLFLLLPYLMLPAAYAFEDRRAIVWAVILGLAGAGLQILGLAVNISYMHWDWLRMNLNPAEAFVYVPRLSAIPAHLSALLAGRYIDLWLVWIWQQFEFGIFLLTLAASLALAALGLHLITNGQVWRTLQLLWQ